jgi:hypothetical protein
VRPRIDPAGLPLMKMAIDTLSPNKGERRITRRPPSAALVAKIASLGLEESLSFAWMLWFALAMSNPPNARRKTGVKKFICFILHCSEAAASAGGKNLVNFIRGSQWRQGCFRDEQVTKHRRGLAGIPQGRDRNRCRVTRPAGGSRLGQGFGVASWW